MHDINTFFEVLWSIDLFNKHKNSMPKVAYGINFVINEIILLGYVSHVKHKYELTNVAIENMIITIE